MTNPDPQNQNPKPRQDSVSHMQVTKEGVGSAVIISANPKSGSGQGRDRIGRLEKMLSESGFDVQVLMDLKEVERQVELLTESGNLRSVVAAGGDGTISLLVNTLPKETPFSILPLGTENLLSKYLGFDGSVEVTAKSVIEAEEVRLDAGKANDSLFLVMASCGFDADVVARMHKIRTGHIGRLSYLGPIWNSIRNYRFPNLEIMIDGKPFRQPAAWSFVFNFPQYAMNLPIITEGNAFDGLLHLRTFRKGGVLRGIRYFLSVLFRQHEKWSEAQYQSGKEIEIRSKGRQVPYQLDGDPGGHLPLKISIQRSRIRMLLSKTMKDKLTI